MSIAPISDSHSTPDVLQRTVEARRREWADLAPAQRAEVLERHTAVRRDRKFYTSLALHRAVLQHLRETQIAFLESPHGTSLQSTGPPEGTQPP